MRRSHKIAAVVIVCATLAAIITFTLVIYRLRLKATGTIKVVGLEAFGDPNATLPVSSIAWGFLVPGDSKNTTLYLKSTSNAPVNLSLTTETWAPESASMYIWLTWDYDGRDLNPGEILPVTLTLHVSEEITGITDFSFDIVITASG